MLDTTFQPTVAQWTATLQAVLEEIDEWCKEAGWRTTREQLQLEEPKLGAYYTDRLIIDAPNGATPHRSVVIEPVACFVVGAEGRVDIVAWPTFDRARLLLDNGAWWIRSDDVTEPRPLRKDTFVETANKLLSVQ
jgi:hypothetical protein